MADLQLPLGELEPAIRDCTEYVLTAYVGTNAEIFPRVLAIYANDGDRILDMTWGKGVFWRQVETSRYDLVRNDMVTECDSKQDFRNTDFAAESFNMVVLDPPYMHMSGTIKESISGCYQNNGSTVLRNQKEVRQLYFDGVKEARRLLKPKGILAIKCQDMIEAGKQSWNHTAFMKMDGWLCEDLFVVVQKSIPARDPKWTKQYHARKNHSFFVVLKKVKDAAENSERKHEAENV